MKAQNVGIVGIEIYFPKLYVSQSELEIYDGASKGKYTIGLGQDNLSFVDSYEDVNSMALTVVKSLMEKYQIQPTNIGRLEVGTETLLDKAKSTKTVLMNLFSQSGNNDIEGVTSINACYGGTNALFNTINWIQSESWDGRQGIVVCVDIAAYPKGPARPTGGAGAVAILLGPDASLVFDQVRSTYMQDAYDFYKPDPSTQIMNMVESEYPIVDGQLSIKTYLNAIDECYNLFRKKYKSRYNVDFSINTADYCAFHSPFFKMVQKSFNKLIEIDVKNDKKLLPNNQQVNDKTISDYALPFWQQKVIPTSLLSKNLGNIYTGSLYSGLISLLDQVDLLNKNVLMFSYGSGLAASMFLLRGRVSTQHIRQNLQLHQRLNQRVKIDPQEYDQIMLKKQNNFGYLKSGRLDVDHNRLFIGAYFVDSINEKWIRDYKRHSFNSTVLRPNMTSVNQLNQLGQRLLHLRDQTIIEAQNIQNDQKVQYSKLWAGFYKKTVQQRLDQLETVSQVNVDSLKSGGLTLQNADLMVENCIGKVSVPMGLGLNFLINGKFYTVPMAIEEPSVIAAASAGAKLVAEAGDGFKSFSTRPVMMGQIQLLDVHDQERVMCIIDKNKRDIINLGNEVAQNMVKRNGGVEEVKARPLKNNQMSIDVYVNVCQSMGANLVNTIVEHIAPFIQEITGCRIGLKILTNYCLERRVSVSFELDINKMGWKGVDGRQVCEMILEAQLFGQSDTFRAVTNNKGILNGISAVALASGQDCRAINSSLHAYACRSGQYQPLTNYLIKEDKFIGTLTVPISIGTQGGAIPSNPVYSTVMEILHYPDSQQLAEIMVSVGLSSNLSALRALCVEGIQKGHMNLHARNLAFASGVPAELVEEAVRFMKNRGKMRKETADEFQVAYNIYRKVRQHTDSKKRVVLSTFSGEFYFEGLSDRIDLHVVFDCGSDDPIHLSFSDKDFGVDRQFRAQIFGAKGYEWLHNLFIILQQVRLDLELEENSVPSTTLAYKLKMLSILINLLASNMISLNFIKSKEFIEEINKQIDHPNIRDLNSLLINEEVPIKYGLNLLCELIRIFKYNLDQSVVDKTMSKILMDELFNIINSHVRTFELWQEVKIQKFDLEQFWNARKKRLSCTMMLLCDALNYNPGRMNLEIIKIIQDLGDIYEVEITLARDTSKWVQPTIIVNDPNVYSYWLLCNNLSFEGDQLSGIKLFFSQSTQLLEQKRSLLEPQLSSKMKHLSGRATQVVKKYYQQQIQKPKL